MALRLPPGYYPYSGKKYQNDNNRGSAESGKNRQPGAKPAVGAKFYVFILTRKSVLDGRT